MNFKFEVPLTKESVDPPVEETDLDTQPPAEDSEVADEYQKNAETTQDVKALAEATGVSQRTAERKTQPARNAQKISLKAQVYEWSDAGIPIKEIATRAEKHRTTIERWLKDRPTMCKNDTTAMCKNDKQAMCKNDKPLSENTDVSDISTSTNTEPPIPPPEERWKEICDMLEFVWLGLTDDMTKPLPASENHQWVDALETALKFIPEDYEHLRPILEDELFKWQPEDATDASEHPAIRNATDRPHQHKRPKPETPEVDPTHKPVPLTEYSKLPIEQARLEYQYCLATANYVGAKLLRDIWEHRDGNVTVTPEKVDDPPPVPEAVGTESTEQSLPERPMIQEIIESLPVSDMLEEIIEPDTEVKDVEPVPSPPENWKQIVAQRYAAGDSLETISAAVHMPPSDVQEVLADQSF